MSNNKPKGTHMRIVNYPHPSPCPSQSIPTTRENLARDLRGLQEADVREDDGTLVATVRAGSLTWL